MDENNKKTKKQDKSQITKDQMTKDAMTELRK